MSLEMENDTGGIVVGKIKGGHRRIEKGKTLWTI